MAWNMIIHLSLTKKVFMEIVEIMKSHFFCKNHARVFWNINNSWIPIRFKHIFRDIIRNSNWSYTFHKLSGKPIIIIISNEINLLLNLSIGLQLLSLRLDCHMIHLKLAKLKKVYHFKFPISLHWGPFSGPQ